ncbi:MAG: acyltransferase [Mycobacterium sp.]|nr:MAG: acyltransferase [Mycobacterium sp.]
MKLEQAFDPRHNALNLWRLILATGVIFWHSFPLTGNTIDFQPAVRLLSEVWVDGFFTVSGFLITASWMRRPHLGEYWRARFLRIFPGLWVCVAVTAFVIAPIAAAVKHSSLPLSAEFAYVVNNGLLNVFYAGINGTPKDIPWPGVWNGSLWTLVFELLCYIAVCVLGVLGLLKRQWVLPTLFVASAVWSAYVSYPTMAQQSIPQMLARFAVVFLAGALIHQYRDAIPAHWSLVALCGVIVIASGFAQNYRLIAALPLAYAIIVSGALVRRFPLRNDISYGMYIYAFPVQQLLATLGLVSLHPTVFFLVAALCTIPLAAASWFVVEKRAMALKHPKRQQVAAGTSSHPK